MRRTSHRVVFSSSWSQVKQAMNMDDDWPQLAQNPEQITAKTSATVYNIIALL